MKFHFPLNVIHDDEEEGGDYGMGWAPVTEATGLLTQTEIPSTATVKVEPSTQVGVGATLGVAARGTFAFCNRLLGEPTADTLMGSCR